MQELDSLSKHDFAKVQLLGDFLTFVQTFFELRTGRPFQISNPIGRESHHITIIKALKKVFAGRTKRLIINVPPRYGKSEILLNFVAWGLANYPDSNYIYTSYSHSLSVIQTQTIKDIVELSYFRSMFGVEIDPSMSAKDDFRTMAKGTVFAAGCGGPITGRGAGIKGSSRWGGCIIIDDAHKPNEATSDAIRGSTNDWYFNTLQSRINDINTPIIYIGQVTHEDDLPTNLKKLKNPDGTPEWDVICLEALDHAGNALYPEMHNKETLLKMQEEMPYVFASQYQQNPLPAGGGLFQKNWFVTLDHDPEILLTFITADTACSEKEYADQTVFSFWGMYRVQTRGIDTGIHNIHWIDCHAVRCEPKDLESEFFGFYSSCMRYKVKPFVAAIEKASTGITLCSILQGIPGLRIINIERTKKGGSKTDRFIDCQPFISSHRVTLTKNAKHTDMCIEHCAKITANNTHRWDDIADTMQTAIQCVFIDGIIALPNKESSDMVMSALTQRMDQLSHLRQRI